MIFQVKKTTQKLLVLLGLIGVLWWALVCKMTFGSYFDIPLFHYAVYLIFLASTGLSIYGWIRTARIEKAINKLTESK
ncbi:hypothetical protein [Priestia megaterium]|uniref:hypothetical protein n=1 Tax=Priestia megaterium TaxID=1404 RepID=UPI0031019B19